MSEKRHTSNDFIKRAKEAGLHNIDTHEAAPDGQLIYHLDGDEERALFEELQGMLTPERERRTAEAALAEVSLADDDDADGKKKKKKKKKGAPEVDPNFAKAVLTSPLYLQDDSTEGRFWLMACMRARKYELDRALDLYFAYLRFRVENGIGDPEDPDEDATQRFISDDINRCCGNVDKCGRYIWAFDAGVFQPHLYTPRAIARGSHHLIEQLYKKHPEAAIRGLLFISNMKGYGYHNFDPETEKVFMQTMTNTLPVRLGSFNMLHMPLVLRMVLSVLKVFMKKKMKERMILTTEEKLLEQIDEAQLDVEFGGSFVRTRDHLIYPCEIPTPKV